MLHNEKEKVFKEIVDFIKELYPGQNPVPLHAPVFFGNEKKYLNDCIDSTFVSYVGKYVTKFEEMTAAYTGAKYAVAVVNGTAALQIALQVSGVNPGDEVITQPLTFVATANAISHCGAKPVFIDVDIDTMGLSPEKLDNWLKKNTKYETSLKKTINQSTNQPITAIVPMHTFGFPCRIDEIVEIGKKFNIPVIEDSAESLGSFYKNTHTGTFGKAGILSYNGNKTITTGGGGMIITDDEEIAVRSKHLTTTGKLPHRWEFIHDVVAYNYRMTNVNAAIGCAQMEKLEEILINKKETSFKYENFFNDTDVKYFLNPEFTNSNYWLNTIILDNEEEKEEFLKFTNDNGIITRPAWRLMNKLLMYRNSQTDGLTNSNYLCERIVNIPSSFRIK